MPDVFQILPAVAVPVAQFGDNDFVGDFVAGSGVKLFKARQNEFGAVDACRILEISNSRMAVSRLDDDEKDDVSLTDASGVNKKILDVENPVW